MTYFISYVSHVRERPFFGNIILDYLYLIEDVEDIKTLTGLVWNNFSESLKDDSTYPTIINFILLKK